MKTLLLATSLTRFDLAPVCIRVEVIIAGYVPSKHVSRPSIRQLQDDIISTTQECRAEWPTGEIGIYAYFEMFIS